MGKKKMAIWEACVLALESLGHPATVKEVYEEIIRNEWYDFNSDKNNEEWLVRTAMGRKARGTNRCDVEGVKYFEFLGENMYRLLSRTVED